MDILDGGVDTVEVRGAELDVMASEAALPLPTGEMLCNAYSTREGGSTREGVAAILKGGKSRAAALKGVAGTKLPVNGGGGCVLLVLDAVGPAANDGKKVFVAASGTDPVPGGKPSVGIRTGIGGVGIILRLGTIAAPGSGAVTTANGFEGIGTEATSVDGSRFALAKSGASDEATATEGGPNAGSAITTGVVMPGGVVFTALGWSVLFPSFSADGDGTALSFVLRVLFSEPFTAANDVFSTFLSLKLRATGASVDPAFLPATFLLAPLTLSCCLPP